MKEIKRSIEAIQASWLSSLIFKKDQCIDSPNNINVNLKQKGAENKENHKVSDVAGPQPEKTYD